MSPRTTAEWVKSFKADGVKIEFKPVVIVPKNDGAYYWATDRIELREHASVSTVFHELSHWTGHQTRLGRNDFNIFNAQSNLREEVIAWETTKSLSLQVGFDFAQADLRLHAKCVRAYEGVYPKAEASAASSYLIHRFGL